MAVKFAIGVSDVLAKDLSVLGCKKVSKVTGNLNKLVKSLDTEDMSDIVIKMEKLPADVVREIFHVKKIRLPFEWDQLGNRQYHLYSAHVEVSDKTFMNDNKYFSLTFLKRARENFYAAKEAFLNLSDIETVEPGEIVQKPVNKSLDNAIERFKTVFEREKERLACIDALHAVQKTLRLDI